MEKQIMRFAEIMKPHLDKHYHELRSENAELRVALAELKNSIVAAHLAGQADAGVDPSYSNAQLYLDKLKGGQNE